MNRVIQERNAQGDAVRDVQVTDVSVTVPGVCAGPFTFVRGRCHTAYDVAAFAIRAARLKASTDDVWVSASSGDLPPHQVFPPQSETVEGRNREHESFCSATHLNVYFRMHGVTP